MILKTEILDYQNAISLVNKYDKIEEIFEDSSKKILNNEHIDFLGEKIKEKKSIFSFFKKINLK